LTISNNTPQQRNSHVVHAHTEKVITMPEASNKEKEQEFDFFNVDKIHSVKGISVSGAVKSRQTSRLRGNRGH